MELKIGDTVTLIRKQGSKMTVEYIVGHCLPDGAPIIYAPGLHKGAVICTWLDYKGNKHGGVFKPEDLIPIPDKIQLN